MTDEINNKLNKEIKEILNACELYENLFKNSGGYKYFSWAPLKAKILGEPEPEIKFESISNTNITNYSINLTVLLANIPLEDGSLNSLIKRVDALEELERELFNKWCKTNSTDGDDMRIYREYDTVKSVTKLASNKLNMMYSLDYEDNYDYAG